MIHLAWVSNMSELTQRVKAKYPQYASVPDDQLEDRVLQKYPQYKPYARKTFGGFLSNIPKSAGNIIKDTGSAVANIFNPNEEKNTVANLGKLAIGTAQYLDPTQALGTQHEDKARAVGSFYKERYGGLDKIKNTVYNDPVGAVADVAGAMTGAGGALRTTGSVASKLGSISTASKLGKAGSVLTKAGTTIDPLLVTTKLAGTGARAVGGKFANAVHQLSEELPTRGMGNPAIQAKAAQKAGQSTAGFMRRYNWWDRSKDSIDDITTEIGRKYDDKALNSNTSVRTGDVIRTIDEQIEKLKNGVNGVVSDADIEALGELQRRREQLLKVAGATETSSPVMTKTRDMTLYRRNVLDKDIPKSTFGLDAQATGKTAGAKKMRDILRKTINSTDPELERLGLDIGQSKELSKVAAGAEARAANRQLLNFSKLGSAGIGGLLAGAPGVIGGFVAEQIVNSPQFLKFASITLQKLSDILPQTKAVIKQNRQSLYRQILEAAQKEGSTDPEVLAKALADRYMSEPAYKKTIDNLGSEVAREFDGKLMEAPLKGTKRATQKIVKDARKTDGVEKASDVRDISRNTIVVPDYRQADKVARSLQSKNKNIVYDPAKKNYFSNPTPAGYRGINTNLKTPSGMAEIQINVPEMIVAKMPIEDARKMLSKKQFNKVVSSGIEPGMGHELYQKSRVIVEDAEALLEQRAKTPSKFKLIDEVYYTPEEAKQLDEINAASNALYEKAMGLHKKSRSGILPTAQAYGFTKNNAKKAVFSTGRAGRMNRSE